MSIQQQQRRYDSLGRPIVDAYSSSGSEDYESSSHEDDLGSQILSTYERNKQYMRSVMTTGAIGGEPTTNKTNNTNSLPTMTEAERRMQDALSTKYPIKSIKNGAERRDPLGLGGCVDTMPVMTKQPVETRFASPSKGVTSIMPTSQLVKLTAQSNGSGCNGGTVTLTPFTEKDYVNNNASSGDPLKSFSPLTMASLGIPSFATTTPLSHHQDCKHKGSTKKKTEPRVLSPFQSPTNNNNNNISGVGCEYHDKLRKEKQRARELLTKTSQPAPQSTPLSKQDREFFHVSQQSPTSVTPLTFSLDKYKTERIAQTLQFTAQLPLNSAARQLMATNGHVNNLACPVEGAAGGVVNMDQVRRHIERMHPEFYHLLKINNLQDTFLYNDLFVVIPDRASLAPLAMKPDPEVANLLRYHLVKNNGTFFQNVQGVAMYDTLLEGKQVQVEKLENTTLLINGRQVLRSDPNALCAIYHVRNGLLSPDEVMPVEEQQEQEQDGGREEEEQQAGDGETPMAQEEQEVPSPDGIDDQGPPSVGEIGEEQIEDATQLTLRSVNDGAKFANKAMSTVVREMSKGFYQASLSFGGGIDSGALSRCANVCMTLTTYDTSRAFNNYQTNQLADRTRVSSQRHYQMKFPAHGDSQTHVSYGNNATFTEYNCDMKACPVPIKKSDLLGGLVALSFNSPLAPTRRTVAVCKMNSQSDNDAVFMSHDENLLMRFRGNFLHTISVNHGALDRNSQQGLLSNNHFIELDSTQHSGPLYQRMLTKSAFDDLMVTHASVKKFYKKAKRAAGKVANKVKRTVNKVISSRLVQVGAPVLLTDDFTAALDALDTGSGVQETLRLVTYDKSHHVRSSGQAPSEIALEKHDMQVGREAVTVYLPTRTDNHMASDYGSQGLVKFVDASLSGRGKIKLDVSHMPANKSPYVYYATSSRDLLVFRFGDDSSLVGLYVIPKTYDLARRLIQGRKS